MTSGKTVTVFGGSGFVGRHVVRALARDGWRIRVAVRRPHMAQFLRPMGQVGQIQLFQANVADEVATARTLEGVDAVVNLVGLLHEGWGGQSFARIHAEAPARLARAAQAAGATQFVQMSSLGVSPDSRAAYARTKAEGEAGVRDAFAGATILRPSIVFGPEDQFFNRFANMARYSFALPLIGGGGTRFQPVYVGDVAQAVANALGGEKDDGMTYELGGPNVYTFRALMEYLLDVVRRRRLLMPLPFFAAKLIAYPASILPGAPLTPDQVELLKTDNVVSPGAKTIQDLGVTPQALEAIVPSYLWRFRRAGQFTPAAQ